MEMFQRPIYLPPPSIFRGKEGAKVKQKFHPTKFFEDIFSGLEKKENVWAMAPLWLSFALNGTAFYMLPLLLKDEPHRPLFPLL
jgi:hypothetical protein